jgi:hypothetical protein
MQQTQNWAVGAAVGVTLIIAALSVFLLVIGSPASEGSATGQCSTGNQCVFTQQFRNYFIPTPVATVPLLMGAVVALGLVKKRSFLSWSGTILLLIFSFVSIFSIGLFYFPFGIALVGFLAIIQNQKHTL